MNVSDLLLRAHGKLTPYYPGKWRVTSTLAQFASDSWNQPRRAKRNGVWFDLDLNDLVPRQIYYDYVYESSETHFIRSVASAGCVAFDCGSHIGYFSLLLARLVGPNGHVHAFEASPVTYAKLLHNIELNGLRNITAVNVGVSDGVGAVQIVEQDTNTGGAYLTPAIGGIPTTSLDAYVLKAGVERLDFMKVDVEGFEMRLLHGAEQTLSRFRPKMLVEVNHSSLRRCGSSAEELLRWIADHQYVVRMPTWHGLIPFSMREAERREYLNVVLTPKRDQ